MIKVFEKLISKMRIFEGANKSLIVGGAEYGVFGPFIFG